MKKIIQHYSNFVAKRPMIIVIAILAFSILMASQFSYLKFQNDDNNDMLPDGVEVIEEFEYISNEFGGTETVSILIELEPKSLEASRLYDDIRSPEIIKYTERLALGASTIQDIESADSAGSIVKQLNNGTVPATINEMRKYDAILVGNYINEEYSATIIKLNLVDNYDPVLLYKNLKSLVDNTPKPTGTKVVLSGNIVIDHEMELLFSEDMSVTSNFALLGILIVILLIFRSFKYGLIPLSTIIFANLWSFGMLGLLRMPITSVMTGVSSMIMGIGIDFGIQVVSRFRYEMETKKPAEAMAETMSNVIVPLSTTTLAAVIGFRAMSLGKLTMMEDIGTMMTFGVLFAMLAAITAVPVLLLYAEKFSEKRSRSRRRRKK